MFIIVYALVPQFFFVVGESAFSPPFMLGASCLHRSGRVLVRPRQVLEVRTAVFR